MYKAVTSTGYSLLWSLMSFVLLSPHVLLRHACHSVAIGTLNARCGRELCTLDSVFMFRTRLQSEPDHDTDNQGQTTAITVSSTDCMLRATSLSLPHSDITGRLSLQDQKTFDEADSALSLQAPHVKTSTFQHIDTSDSTWLYLHVSLIAQQNVMPCHAV